MTDWKREDFPTHVKIMEVGPRDGLQNESCVVDTAVKRMLITRLVDAGLKWIEATSFVSPKAIPQLQDAEALLTTLPVAPGVVYPVLVPNEQGLNRALAAKATHVAIFLSASETFSQKNIRMSISESLAVYQAVVQTAKSKGLWVRGYISCVMGCPYEGTIAPEAVVSLAKHMQSWGVDEIALGDTIGVGTPLQCQYLIQHVRAHVPIEKIAVHFHDTYGQGLANILAALSLGVSVVDCSVGGLGGCPYARGATGNVASEDVIYMLMGLGIQTGVDLTLLAETGRWICNKIGRSDAAKAGNAWLQRQAR